VVLSEMIEVFDVLSCFVVMFDLVEFNSVEFNWYSRIRIARSQVRIISDGPIKVKHGT
jgi:hypothetical protein